MRMSQRALSFEYFLEGCGGDSEVEWHARQTGSIRHSMNGNNVIGLKDENTGKPKMSEKIKSKIRYGIGLLCILLALHDVIRGGPGDAGVKWRWLQAMAVNAFGPWGDTILLTVIGVLFLYWGFVSED